MKRWRSSIQRLRDTAPRQLTNAILSPEMGQDTEHALIEPGSVFDLLVNDDEPPISSACSPADHAVASPIVLPVAGPELDTGLEPFFHVTADSGVLRSAPAQGFRDMLSSGKW